MRNHLENMPPVAPVPVAAIEGVAASGFINGAALVGLDNQPTAEHGEIIFEFTRDPASIHQYYRIYEAEFKAVLNADYHHDDNDPHDHDAHFLIVRDGNHCIGGARLSVRSAEQPLPLPIEMHDFELVRHFPQLAETHIRYGQIGRLCLLPEYRGGTVTRSMFWHFFEKSVALNLDMIFATAPLIIARGHMKHFIAMGLPETRIHREIDLPPYPMCETIKFYLMSVIVDKSRKVFPQTPKIS